ncbi:hypothetical protein ADN00_11555 [Ornatilinea apprima]|uniref:Uncharacterized protein n=1 Tax=Ornatilinea apprima TaxID=1134406 RepID=A0A0P6X108_9CHLR|nr:hypothetical protein [Ornatilinea apprima]KPL75995.1 hypothetical protein ADN00_11555 [Ornatilinea apprima]
MRSEIERLFNELNSEPVETGFANLVEGLDIDINYYESYIAGMVTVWLNGSSLPFEQVDRGEDLNQRLDQAIECILRFKQRKCKIDQIVDLLLKNSSVHGSTKIS